MNAKIKTTNTLSDISLAVKQVEQILRDNKVKTEHIVKATLTLEETLVRISELTAGEKTQIQIAVNKGLRKCNIRISYKGRMISTADLFTQDGLADELDDEFGPEAEGLIRDMVLRGGAERLTVRHSRGVNTITLLVAKTENALIYDTLTALGLGLFIGIITRIIANPEVTEWISGNFFMPLYEIFLTLISMIIAPFIFFSLVSCISGFQDMSTLGRTGSKVFGSYMLTTMLGLLMCIGAFFLIEPGKGSTFELPMPTGTESEIITLSLMDKLISIIPTNFIGSFVENDMLKIMFLAILVGATLGRTGKHAERLKNSFDALNELFGKVTSALACLLPVAIFGSTANMAATLDVGAVGSLMSWVGFLLLGVLLQFCLYIALILVLGRVNPLPFLRKFTPAMVTALMTDSSSITIPTSLDCCRKMGISPRIFSFSIPLGANINMDGTSLCFCGTTLFLANLYGITVTPGALLSLVVTIMLISVALPGVPGAGTACMILVFAIVGVPAEALGIVIGLHPLMELIETALNVTGDGTVTVIVASSEKAIDMDMYNKQ